ncbi:MAG: putative cupredoxin-like copper-binding protein [Oleiphilaceae bacterium]|jgi:uncharacterized cupredoxin-like copper-binding protein
MKRIFTPLLISTVILMTAYSNYGHSSEDHYHKAKSDHHNMEEDHHDIKESHHDKKESHHDMKGSHHDKKESHHNSEAKSSHHGGSKKHHQNMMGHDHAMDTMTGAPGEEANVSRTIIITADDTMRFMHEPLNIKESETIKFIVTNKGAIAHEFAIATKDEHLEHGKMMMKNPAMHHGPGGNVVSIKPGETETLIWAFKGAMQIEAACNIPGHYEAGMHSPINIKGK